MANVPVPQPGRLNEVTPGPILKEILEISNPEFFSKHSIVGTPRFAIGEDQLKEVLAAGGRAPIRFQVDRPLSAYSDLFKQGRASLSYCGMRCRVEEPRARRLISQCGRCLK